MTKRVLQVFTAMNVGGAETMILNLYKAMNQENIQFDFLVHSDEIGYYENEILRLGGRIFRLPYPKLKSIKFYQNQLFELLKTNKFCAIHSHAHSFSGFILETAKKAAIPVRVAHSHTTSDGRDQTIFRKVYQSYMKYNLRNHATHMLGCSQTAGESLFGKNADTIVLPNSIDLNVYEQLSKQDSTKSVDRLAIGHVGRFDAVKNHSFFLEAFYHFKKGHPQASAVLVGDGPEKGRILDAIKAYQLQDSVKLLGIRADVPEILSGLDAFLFPSIYEGLGNVVIEAQAAGIPCLVSDSLPREVDLSMNLVTFKDLQMGAEAWAVDLARIIDVKKRPSWAERKSQLNKFGYDVVENAKYIEKIYSGC